MWSVVISSLKFDNKSFWNNPKISVPKMCKIVVSWSLKGNFDIGLQFFLAKIPELVSIYNTFCRLSIMHYSCHVNVMYSSGNYGIIFAWLVKVTLRLKI